MHSFTVWEMYDSVLKLIVNRFSVWDRVGNIAVPNPLGIHWRLENILMNRVHLNPLKAAARDVVLQRLEQWFLTWGNFTPRGKFDLYRG